MEKKNFFFWYIENIHLLQTQNIYIFKNVYIKSYCHLKFYVLSHPIFNIAETCT